MRSAHILLAEDYPDLRELLTVGLRTDGHCVQPVARGDDLLHALLALRDGATAPDVIVSDVEMPGMGGLDALELAGVHGRALPIVLMTGRSDAKTSRRASQLEVHCILTKPFELASLRAAVLALPSRR